MAVGTGAAAVVVLSFINWYNATLPLPEPSPTFFCCGQGYPLSALFFFVALGQPF